MDYPWRANQPGVVLDVETFGLSQNSPIWEAALLDLQSGEKKHWYVKPYAGRSRLTRAELPHFMEPWTRSRYEATGEGTLGEAIRQANREGVHPKQFLTELFSAIEGKQVFIANAPFEARKIGSMARTWLSPSEIVSASKQFETAPAGTGHLGNTFYVTGRGVQEARSVAFATGDWTGVASAMRGPPEAAWARGGGVPTTVSDIQDIARSMFTRASRLGLVGKAGGVYTGTAVGILARAFGEGLETHRASDDVSLEGRLIPKLTKAESDLETLSSEGLIKNFKRLFLEQDLETLNALKRLSAVRGEMKARSIERAFAEARLAFLKGDLSYQVATERKVYSVPMFEYASDMETTGLISAPWRQKPNSYEEAVEMLKRVHAPTAGGINMTALATRVGGMEKPALEALVHTGITLKEAAIKDKGILRSMAMAGEWGLKDSAGFLLRRHPGKIGGLFLGGAVGIEIISSTIAKMLSPDKNDRLDIDGLYEGGEAAELRKRNANFGSGWGGIFSSIWAEDQQQTRDLQEQYRRWKRTIWQDEGRRLALQATLKEEEKRAQETLGSLDADEAKVLTMEQIAEIQSRSGGALFQGVNTGNAKNMVVADISPDKYNYEFEDADTLVLRKRGFLGISTGKPISIRLAGLDAPEIAEHKQDPLASVRIAQAQPYGETAAARFKELIQQQDSLSILYDPTATTYGRHIGVLFGEDNQNINLQLVRSGVAAHLPFGESGTEIIDREMFQRAEDTALKTNMGLWQEPFWKGYRVASEAARTRITFNTLTRMDKLAKDAALEQLFFQMWGAEEEGSITGDEYEEFFATGKQLSRTYGRWNKSNTRRKNLNRASRKGNYRDHNDVRGFQHQGKSAESRRAYGFGSPFIGETPWAVVSYLQGVRKWGILDKILGRGIGGMVRLAKTVDRPDLPEMWGALKLNTSDIDKNVLFLRPEFSIRERTVASRYPNLSQSQIETLVERNMEINWGATRTFMDFSPQTQALTMTDSRWEAFLTRKARAMYGDVVPMVHEETAQTVLSEYAGIGVREAVARGLTTTGKVQQFIVEQTAREAEKGLFHLDLHLDQMTWDPFKQIHRVLDWSTAVLHPNPVAKGRIIEHREELVASMQHWTNLRREQAMAGAQREAGMNMFRSPISHTRGGS